MAQILVQPRRKNYWWLWLLILVIISGVVYYLYSNNMLPMGKSTVSNSINGDSSVNNENAVDAATTDTTLH